MISTTASNPRVIEIFKEELPTFSQLNDGVNRQVYPLISKATENSFRKQFGISQSETLLYTQEMNLCNRNDGSYEIMGLVITDLGIRICISDPMAFCLFPFDQHLNTEYNAQTGCIVFYDDRSKIKTEDNSLPFFLFVNGVDDSIFDQFGAFFVSFFQRIKGVALSSEKADKLVIEWRQIYNNLQYKRERTHIIDDINQTIADDTKSLPLYEKELREISSVKKIVAGFVLLIIGGLCFPVSELCFLTFPFLLCGLASFYGHFKDVKNAREPILERIAEKKRNIEKNKNFLDEYIRNNPENLDEETLEKWAAFRSKDAMEYLSQVMQHLQSQNQNNVQNPNNSNDNHNYGIMDAVGDFNNGVKIGNALCTLFQLFR